MELKEFVAETLCQIVEAVATAQEKTKETGALINPTLLHSSTGPHVCNSDADNEVPHMVNFDVTLAVESSGTAGGEAKISVLMLNIGGGAESRQSSTEHSRITFSVPVCWPLARAARQGISEPCAQDGPSWHLQKR